MIAQRPTQPISCVPSFEAFSSTPPEPTLTDDERDKVPAIATTAYFYLCSQDHKTMSLGDFIAELREYDIRAVVIDEVLSYMSTNGWVDIWQARGSGENWISVVEEGDKQ